MERFCIALLTLLVLPTQAQPLRVDSSGHWLLDQQDKPFFWLADTGWEMMHRLDRTEVETYLAKRKQQGFNIIQTTILYELEAFESPNAYHDFPLIDGQITQIAQTTGDDPTDELAYDYWDHVRYIVESAKQKELLLAILPCWGEYVTPRFGVRTIGTPEHGYKYGYFLGTWLKDYNDQLIWMLGGDRLPDEQPMGVAIWRAMAEGITDGVANTPGFDGIANYDLTFMTYHCYSSSSNWFADDPWIDIHTWGSYHEKRSNERAYLQAWNEWNHRMHKPFINSEPAYENLPINYDWQSAASGKFNAFDVRQIAYWSVFAGACGHTYGANEVWQMYDHHRPIAGLTDLNSLTWKGALDSKGANQMQHLRNLMLSFDALSRMPDTQVIAKNVYDPIYGPIVATRGHDYLLVYSPAGKDIWLHTQYLPAGQLTYSLFNPRSGHRNPTQVAILDEHLLKAELPGSITPGNDWVLIIQSKE